MYYHIVLMGKLKYDMQENDPLEIPAVGHLLNSNFHLFAQFTEN